MTKSKKETNKAPKNLSISMLKPEVDMYNETVEIFVTPQGYEEQVPIKIYPLFSPQNTAKLVNEYLEFLALCNKEKVTVNQEDEGDILGYFIVKYFTDIKTTKSKKAKTIIEEVNLLKNSMLYKELMELFPKESVASVHSRIFELNEAFGELEKQYKNIQKQYENLDLENREEIENAFGKVNTDATH